MSATATTESSSNHVQGCLQLANDLILAHRLLIPRVTSLADLKSFVFVELFKAICKVQIPELISDPQTSEDEVHNIQAIIDTLSLDILSISLYHITGEDVVLHNARSIYNLLEIFNGLSNQVHSIASSVSHRSDPASPEAESPNYHSDSTERENGVCTCLSLGDFQEKEAVPRSKSSASTSSSESGSTAECIALGKTRYLSQKCLESFHRYADAAIEASEEKKKGQPLLTESEKIERPEREFSKGDYKIQDDFHSKIKPLSYVSTVIIPDVKCVNENIHLISATGDSVPLASKYPSISQKIGVDINFATDGVKTQLEKDVETKEDSSSSSSHVLKYGPRTSTTSVGISHGLKRKRGKTMHIVDEIPDTETLPSTLATSIYTRTKDVENYPFMTEGVMASETESSVSSGASLYQKTLSAGDVLDLIVKNGRASISSGKSQTVTAGTQTDDTIVKKKYLSRTSQTKKPTAALKDVENLYSTNTIQVFSEKLQESKRIRLQASLMDEKYKSTVSKPPAADRIGSSRKSFLLPKHLRKRSRGPVATRRAISLPEVRKRDSGDSLVQRLQKQFPGVQLSQSTLKQMEKKEKQHAEMLQRTTEEILARRPKSQSLLENEIEKQKKVSEILKKDAADHQRHTEVLEHRQQKLELRSLLHHRKVQSIRLKQYHANYYVDLKTKMRGIRTKEEQLVYKLFEDTLKVKTEDLREAQKILKEEEEKDEEFQRNYLQALENFHRNQLEQIKNRLQVQEHDLQNQFKEQSRILKAKRRENRHQLEQNVQAVQSQIISELENDHLIDLEAQKLRERLYQRKGNLII